MQHLTDEQNGWLAGVVSCFGIFSLKTQGWPYITLLIKSARHPGMVKKFAKLSGHPVQHKPRGDEVRIHGQHLDIFWALIFRNVTPERDAEYTSLRNEQVRIQKQIRADAEEKKLYEAERANAPRSTPDQIRRREEALYHNQDPAVQIVDGFVEAEMAQSYDLDQARQQREREARKLAPYRRRS